MAFKLLYCFPFIRFITYKNSIANNNNIPAQQLNYKKEFELLDLEKKGSLNYNQVRNLVKLFHTPSENDLQSIMDYFHMGNQVSLKEFLFLLEKIQGVLLHKSHNNLSINYNCKTIL